MGKARKQRVRNRTRLSRVLALVMLRDFEDGRAPACLLIKGQPLPRYGRTCAWQSGHGVQLIKRPATWWPRRLGWPGPSVPAGLKANELTPKPRWRGTAFAGIAGYRCGPGKCRSVTVPAGLGGGRCFNQEEA